MLYSLALYCLIHGWIESCCKSDVADFDIPIHTLPTRPFENVHLLIHTLLEIIGRVGKRF